MFGVARRHIALGVLATVGVGLSAGPAAGQTPSPSQQEYTKLNQQMLDHYNQKEYDKGIEVGNQMLALKDIPPAGRASVHYNLACLYSLKGEKAKALDLLKQAVDGGFNNLVNLKADRDTDFANINTEEGFKAIVAKLEKTSAPYKDKAAASKALIVTPTGLDASKPATVIVALHGFSRTAEEIVGSWKDVAQEAGAILVAPRAIRPAAPGFSWGDVDESEIIVMNALKEVGEKHKIDPQRVVLTGFSQGASLTFNIGLRHGKEFCGAIPVAGHYELAPGTSLGSESAAKTKFYIIAGEKDERVIASNRKAEKELQAAKFPVKLATFADLGHDFPKERAAELKKALDFVLGK